MAQIALEVPQTLWIVGECAGELWIILRIRKPARRVVETFPRLFASKKFKRLCGGWRLRDGDETREIFRDGIHLRRRAHGDGGARVETTQRRVVRSGKPRLTELRGSTVGVSQLPLAPALEVERFPLRISLAVEPIRAVGVDDVVHSPGIRADAPRAGIAPDAEHDVVIAEEDPIVARRNLRTRVRRADGVGVPHDHVRAATRHAHAEGAVGGGKHDGVGERDAGSERHVDDAEVSVGSRRRRVRDERRAVNHRVRSIRRRVVSRAAPRPLGAQRASTVRRRVDEHALHQPAIPVGGAHAVFRRVPHREIAGKRRPAAERHAVPGRVRHLDARQASAVSAREDTDGGGVRGVVGSAGVEDDDVLHSAARTLVVVAAVLETRAARARHFLAPRQVRRFGRIVGHVVTRWKDVGRHRLGEISGSVHLGDARRAQEEDAAPIPARVRFRVGGVTPVLHEDDGKLGGAHGVDRGAGEDDDGWERAYSARVAHAPPSRVDVGAVRAHSYHRAGLHVELLLDDHGAHHRDGVAVVLPGDDPVVQPAVDVGIPRGRRGARPREELLRRVVGIVGIDVRAGNAAEGEQEHHRQRPEDARETARARDGGHGDHPRHGRPRRNDDVNAGSARTLPRAGPRWWNVHRGLCEGSSRARASRRMCARLAHVRQTPRDAVESAREMTHDARVLRGASRTHRGKAPLVSSPPRYTREKTSEMNRTIWASWSELPEPIEFNTSMAGTIPFMWRCSLYFLRNSPGKIKCAALSTRLPVSMANEHFFERGTEESSEPALVE